MKGILKTNEVTGMEINMTNGETWLYISSKYR